MVLPTTKFWQDHFLKYFIPNHAGTSVLSPLFNFPVSNGNSGHRFDLTVLPQEDGTWVGITTLHAEAVNHTYSANVKCSNRIVGKTEAKATCLKQSIVSLGQSKIQVTNLTHSSSSNYFAIPLPVSDRILVQSIVLLL